MKKIKINYFKLAFFPTNTIPGIYNVDIYYIRNNTIMSTDQKNIVIKKWYRKSNIWLLMKMRYIRVFVISFQYFQVLLCALFRRSK